MTEAASGTTKTVLVTGGAGFVGSNLVERLLSDPGIRVRILDNFSRRGVLANVAWLRSLADRSRLEIVEEDVRNAKVVASAARDAGTIYHLAAQVAVTTSIDDPVTDFETNARGTLNVLEAARTSGRQPLVVFTSTNKVYGSLEHLPVAVQGMRYEAQREGFAGVTESEPLDFHSPYGCSKGAADQYVRDYARIYDLPAVVLRMSCIAGPRQFGNEDQGWVAHFLYSVLQGRTITVCGNGFQTRDILHVQDVVDAMLAVQSLSGSLTGEVFNLGGGMDRAVSVMEMLRACEERAGRPMHLSFSETRPGDQPLYISNTGKLEAMTGWKPRRSLSDVLDSVESFWHANRAAITGYAADGQAEAQAALQLTPQEVV